MKKVNKLLIVFLVTLSNVICGTLSVASPVLAQASESGSDGYFEWTASDSCARYSPNGEQQEIVDSSKCGPNSFKWETSGECAEWNALGKLIRHAEDFNCGPDVYRRVIQCSDEPSCKNASDKLKDYESKRQTYLFELARFYGTWNLILDIKPPLHALLAASILNPALKFIKPEEPEELKFDNCARYSGGGRFKHVIGCSDKSAAYPFEIRSTQS